MPATTYVALLRGINVGSHKRVAMSDLRDLAADLGLHEARSLLQSGNLVFESNRRSTVDLERSLELAATKRLGLETDFFVRTAQEWKEVIARNPFREAARRDPSHLLVLCLKSSPTGAQVKALRSAIKGPEEVSAAGKHAYAVFPSGIGRSPLTSAVIERNLGTRATGRNWNTVLKLGAMAGP